MRRLTYANVMATIAVVLAVGGGSYAIAQPGSKGTINGCVNKKSGVLRALSNPGKRCKRSERAISWNVEGRAGRDGSPGASGAKGADGTAGAPGQTGPAGSPDTAQQVLEKLATVDGPASGLDADTLDGISSHRFPLEVGGSARLLEFSAEAYDDPGECVEERFDIEGLRSSDYLLASVLRSSQELLPSGVMASVEAVRHLDPTVDRPQAVARICNVSQGVVESGELSLRVRVYR